MGHRGAGERHSAGTGGVPHLGQEHVWPQQPRWGWQDGAPQPAVALLIHGTGRDLKPPATPWAPGPMWSWDTRLQSGGTDLLQAPEPQLSPMKAHGAIFLSQIRARDAQGYAGLASPTGMATYHGPDTLLGLSQVAQGAGTGKVFLSALSGAALQARLLHVSRKLLGAPI